MSGEQWRPSRELQAVLDAREMEANRNYAAEFFRAIGASDADPIDYAGFAAWLRQQHRPAADRMARIIEDDLRRPAPALPGEQPGGEER